MTRLPPMQAEQTTGEHRVLFDQISNAFGTIPNMFKAIGNSPAALASMFGSFGALGGGTLGAQLGEQIAVLVADINECEYCLAAHTALGQNAGLSVETLANAQRGNSGDIKVQAALDFSAKIVRQRAKLSDADVEQVRAAGFSDDSIAEMLAHVALNIFTNYTNVAFDVPVDFPKINLSKAA